MYTQSFVQNHQPCFTLVSSMGVRGSVFRGGQTIFWTGQKTISTPSTPKFLLKLADLYLKFHKSQIPGPAKCSLPIGVDAHGQLGYHSTTKAILSTASSIRSHNENTWNSHCKISLEHDVTPADRR